MYRIVPSMMRSKFLLSPLVENTHEYKNLENMEYIDSSAKNVVSLKISIKNQNFCWEPNYTISFYKA
jgi:hypothetical protein